MCWSVFFVSAVTANPFVYFDSAPDSGYSKDNIAPTMPLASVPTYDNGVFMLDWQRSLEPDFWIYRLYRGMAADFVPDLSNLVVTKADVDYVGSAPAGSYFKLSAVDLAGNESPFATMTLAYLLDADAPLNLRFGLGAVHPNPARAGRLSVEFALAKPGPARLELLDIAGRRVIEREVGSLGVGRHLAHLAHEVQLAPGLYVVRLSQGGSTATRRVCVLD
jgi:hypothetical protein